MIDTEKTYRTMYTLSDEVRRVVSDLLEAPSKTQPESLELIDDRLNMIQNHLLILMGKEQFVPELMNFERFQKSRVYGPLPDCYKEAYEYPNNQVPKGWVYAGWLVIEDTTTWSNPSTPAKGPYYLMIGNLEWTSNSLEELERRLFDFYVSQNPID